VQKRIYQSLGGTSKYDEEVWQRFGDRMGWKINNEWVLPQNLTFSEEAPEAHFPAYLLANTTAYFWVWCGVSSLASRLMKCNI
jgi:hypothetical protein